MLHANTQSNNTGVPTQFNIADDQPHFKQDSEVDEVNNMIVPPPMKAKWARDKLSNTGGSDHMIPADMFRHSLYEDAAQCIPVIPKENMVFANHIKRNQFRNWMAMVWGITPNQVIIDSPTFKNEKVWKANPPHHHLQCTLDWAIVMRRRPIHQSTWTVVSLAKIPEYKPVTHLLDMLPNGNTNANNNNNKHNNMNMVGFSFFCGYL